MKRRRIIEHQPQWRPAPLRVVFAGQVVTVHGYICVHLLEDGNGQCGGTVLRVEDSIGAHACVVGGPPGRRSRMRSAYRRRRWGR